jgi:hypothetical protein
VNLGKRQDTLSVVALENIEALAGGKEEDSIVIRLRHISLIVMFTTVEFTALAVFRFMNTLQGNCA